jgi:hypothetical protein
MQWKANLELQNVNEDNPEEANVEKPAVRLSSNVNDGKHKNAKT